MQKNQETGQTGMETAVSCSVNSAVITGAMNAWRRNRNWSDPKPGVRNVHTIFRKKLNQQGKKHGYNN